MSSPKFSLENKVVAVVGCVSGIGLATVEILLEEKNVKGLALLDFNTKSGEELLERLTKEYPSKKIIFHKCDVTSKQEIENAFDVVWESFGTVDLLINVAGIFNEKNWRLAIDVNITGVIESSLQGLGRMRRDKGGPGGTIINMSSLASLYPNPYLLVYCATKYAVRSFTTSLGLPLRYEMTGVRTISFCPNYTMTPMIDSPSSYYSDPYIVTKYRQKTEKEYYMRPEVTAGGLLRTYELGESASVWIMDRNKLTLIPESSISLPPSYLET